MTRALLRLAATIRLTELIVEDEITRPLRDYTGRRWPRSIGYLMSCPRCVSVWAGLFCWLAPDWMNGALAASTVTIQASEARDRAARRAFERKAAVRAD